MISDTFMKTVTNHICVYEEKIEAINGIVEEVKLYDDAWLCDLIQCGDVLKYPAVRHKKVSDYEVEMLIRVS